LRVDTESVVSLLIGGIAFANFAHEEAEPEADAETIFTLYDTYDQARGDRYTAKRDYMVEFRGSVRGLSIGAPVEFRGIKIGTVTDFKLETDADALEFVIPVQIRLEPERLGIPIGDGEGQPDGMGRMVRNGLRAQLQTGNLLTGQLYVALEFFDNPPPADMRYRNGLPVIPTMPSPSQEITQGLTRFVKKLDQLPLDAMGRDLQRSLAGMNRLVNSPDLADAVKTLQRLLSELAITTQTLNAETVPRINAALVEMETVLKDLDQWVSTDAPLQDDLRRMLKELSAAGRAVRDLADMLERQPEALIQGKGSEARQ
jgi:paraquat-inducible protein B